MKTGDGTRPPRLPELPTDYVRRRCRELGLDYLVFLTRFKVRKYTDARRTIAVELHRKYGLASTRIGILLGGRDHTTVLHYLRRAGIEAKPRSGLDPELVRKVRELSEGGMRNYHIAELANVSQTDVWRILNPEAYNKPRASRRRSYELQQERRRAREEEVRKMIQDRLKSR